MHQINRSLSFDTFFLVAALLVVMAALLGVKGCGEANPVAGEPDAGSGDRVEASPLHTVFGLDRTKNPFE